MDRRETNRPQKLNEVEIDIWKELGVPKPQYEDETHAPPVDWDGLRALLRQELAEDRAREITLLLVRFRSWAEGMAEVARESFNANYPKGPPLPG